MNKQISHNWNDERIEAKVRWFRSLNLTERMDMLCMFTDMILSVNPELAETAMLNQLPDVFSSLHKHEVKYLVSPHDTACVPLSSPQPRTNLPQTCKIDESIG
jgi:hypothetical protein